MLQLLALDAGEFNLMGRPPFACRSSGTNSKHELSPVFSAKMWMELNDKRGCFHGRLTPELSRAAKRRRLE